MAKAKAGKRKKSSSPDRLVKTLGVRVSTQKKVKGGMLNIKLRDK